MVRVPTAQEQDVSETDVSQLQIDKATRPNAIRRQPPTSRYAPNIVRIIDRRVDQGRPLVAAPRSRYRDIISI